MGAYRERVAMKNMSVTPNDYKFGDVHAAMRRYVDADILAGVSSAVLVV
jgi:hypothetical protein